MAPKRAFRKPKGAEEEKDLFEISVPRSTPYITKWTRKIYLEWQHVRENKIANKEDEGFQVDLDKA